MSDKLGFISLHRQLQDNWLWLSEPFTRGQAWVDMLMLTNHKSNSFFIRGNRIDVKRGQIAQSMTNLATRWKWSRKKVIAFMDMLEKEQQITQQKSRLITVLTIKNYPSFQKKGTTEEQQKIVSNCENEQNRGQQNTQQRSQENKGSTPNNEIKNEEKGTTEGTTEEQQKNTNNNVNNDNNDIKEYIDSFSEFWELYTPIITTDKKCVPKGSKKKAQQAFEKALKKSPYEEIKEGLRKYLTHCKKNNQLTKQPVTWLNQECWEDDYNNEGVAVDNNAKRGAIAW